MWRSGTALPSTWTERADAASLPDEYDALNAALETLYAEWATVAEQQEAAGR